MRVELSLEAFSSSKLAQKLRRHLAPLDPEPSVVEDRGDGSYAVHLPGMRPRRPPRPAITPYEEDVAERLSVGKWDSKIVRMAGTEYDELAVVESVRGHTISIRWLDSGRQVVGEPSALLGAVDERTLVSDRLQGRVETTEAFGVIEIKALEVAESGQGPMT